MKSLISLIFMVLLASCGSTGNEFFGVNKQRPDTREQIQNVRDIQRSIRATRDGIKTHPSTRFERLTPP